MFLQNLTWEQRFERAWHDFVPKVEAPALAGTALGITIFLTALFLFTWEKGVAMVKNEIIISIV